MTTKQNIAEERGLLSRDMTLRRLRYRVRQNAPKELLSNKRDGAYYMDYLKYFQIKHKLDEINFSPGCASGSALVSDYRHLPHFYSEDNPDRVFLYVLKPGLVEIGMSAILEENAVVLWPFSTKKNLEKLLVLLDLPVLNT